MSRHPEYAGRMLTRCCEEAPDLDGSGITYACTRRRRHRGPHRATVPDGTVLATWLAPDEVNEEE